MFKCDFCFQNAKPREAQNKVVVQFRSKQYFETVKTVDKEGNESYHQGNLLGEGFETVRENTLCKSCWDNERERVPTWDRSKS